MRSGAIASKRMRVRGRFLKVDYPDTSAMETVVENVLAGKEYPLVLPKRLRPRTIIDVGGNVGAAALWFRANYPAAEVHSFEPSPTLFSFLQSNTEEWSRVFVHGVGLSDRSGQQTLYLGQRNAAQSSLVKHESVGEAVERVEIRRASETLSELGIEQISILKLDTEGSELAILRDLNEWFDRISAIYVEYHSEADRRAIDALMADRFYLIHASVHFPNLGTLVYCSREIMEASARYISPPIPSD